MIDNLEVGELMRKIRKQKGFTAMELARRLEVSQQKLSRIEKGEQSVSISLLYQYCIICEMTIMDFFYQLEKRTQFDITIKESETLFLANPNMMLLRVFSTLSMDEKRALLKLIYAFK
jgi:transcriptional regulator with XRE-family HTH domain